MKFYSLLLHHGLFAIDDVGVTLDDCSWNFAALQVVNLTSFHLSIDVGNACGNVLAKTGTLSGISSLAGYLTTADGRQLCFAIINQGVMRNKDGKDFQDRVCTALCE